MLSEKPQNPLWRGPTRASLLCAALLAAGCGTPPAYEKPALETPAAFKEAAGWKAANPGAAEVPDAWWQLFNDPVLNSLQQRVVVDNQTLRASVAQYHQAQAALAASRASLFPTLGAGLSASRADSGSGGSTLASRPATSYSLSGTASWEVDLWGRLASTVSASQAQLQASQADLAAARLSVQATLSQTYFSLRAAEEQMALLDRTIEAYQRSLQLTQNRYGGGVASSADVAQAESQLKSTQAQRVEAGSSRAQLEHALAVLLGQPPSSFGLSATATLPQAPDTPVQLPSELLERRPDIAAAERRVAAANAQVGMARAAFFPSLTLSAAAGYRGSSLGSLLSAPNLFWSLGPSLALSIFDGGARQAGVDSARASLELASANYRQSVLTAFQEVEDNLVIAASLRQEAELQAQALAAARRSLAVAENQYRAGTVSYLNVVTAQATALASERTLLDVRNRRLAALNQLLKNIAGRWDVPRPLTPPAS